jgi:hypothetical protein
MHHRGHGGHRAMPHVAVAAAAAAAIVVQRADAYSSGSGNFSSSNDPISGSRPTSGFT